MNNRQLQTAYEQILSTPETAFLQDETRQAGDPKGYSGLFLASVRDGYADASNKVMIVGSETAGWDPLKSSQDIADGLSGLPWQRAYVTRSMRVHGNYFAKCLKQKNRDRGHTFMNYVRDIAAAAGEDGLIYANLFCFDWRRGSPMRSPDFDRVRTLSRQLLHAQIDILKPDVIVFANGISSAGHRREFFPVGPGGRCSAATSQHETISSHYLWEFTLDERIPCLRVHHPSARRKEAGIGRRAAVMRLAGLLNRSPQPSQQVSAVAAGV